MDTKLFQQVLEYLKTTGEFVAKTGFEITVRQVYANAVGYFISAFFMILLFILCVVFFVKLNKKCKENDDSMDDFLVNNPILFFVAFLATIGVVISPIVLCDLLITATKMLINPYWYAIEMILSLVNGG